MERNITPDRKHLLVAFRPVLGLLLFIFMLSVPSRILAQTPGIKKDSSDHIYAKKRFGRSTLLFSMGEVVPWAWDRFGVNADYSRISVTSEKYTLNPAHFTWDNDGFQTNQIGHPFHGSVFFNAVRSNGYNFWQSIPATFGGSYIWETAAETQAPSINDFINTGFGGVMLGEVTHRMTNRILNNHSHGFKRQMSEVFALLINPSNGLNRIMDGKWGSIPGNPADRDSTPINAELDLGLRKFNVDNKNPFKDGHFGLYGRLRLQYGSPSESMREAFSNVNVTIEAGQDDSSKLNIVSLYGSLAGWKVYTKNNTHLAILSANYDYINNAAFFYSAEGVRMNFYSEFRVTDKVKFNTAAGAGIVILAAIPDGYTYNSRNYDYGPGASYYGTVKLSVLNRLFYTITYRGGVMGTVNGNPSNYLLHTLTNELSLRIADKLSLSAEEGYFNLHGNYRHFPDVNKTYPYVRLSLKYGFDL